MKIKTILLAVSALMLSGNNLQARTINPDDKVLVVYFSHSGNTKEIADQIRNAAKADIFEIQPLHIYPDEYRQLTEQAKKEISDGYKPALKSRLANINGYNVIFVGSPCWWSTIAPPVATFLSEYDFSEKTIIPFMTHGGSRLGRSVADIKKLLPNSTVVDGRAFQGNNVKNSNNEVNKWVKGLQND